jgi:hypothetical protein
MNTDPKATELRGTTTRASLRALVAAALVGATLLSACGSSGAKHASKADLNMLTVETDIQNVLAKRHLLASVTCPASVPQRKGEDFVCTTVAYQAKYRKLVEDKTRRRRSIPSTRISFKVIQQNSSGSVAYKIE